MKKTIAVLVQEIWSDYIKEALKGIFEYFRNTDYNVLLVQVRLETFEQDTFGLQYMSGIKLLETKAVDCVIVGSPTFCSHITPEELTKYLEPIQNKKIVSLSIPLKLNNTVRTRVSCKNAYSEFVRHVIAKHGAKKFAFMGVESEKSIEAKERLDAFKLALKENKVKFDENEIYYGEFVVDSAYNALKEKIKSKNDVKFDTIFAANDAMAFGCISYLTELGLRVPQDVRVIGFDDIDSAKDAEIPLATINQQIEEQGNTVAFLADQFVNGVKVPSETTIDVKAICRESAGCKINTKKKQLYLDGSEYSDSKGNAIKPDVLSYELQFNKIFSLLDSTRSEETLKDLYDKLSVILKWLEINFFVVVLYDEPISTGKDEIIDLPETAKMVFCVDKKRNLELVDVEYKFNLAESYLPKELFGNVSYHYSYQPIFYGNVQYGYLIGVVEDQTISLSSIFLKIICNEISQAYKYTKVLEEKDVLEKKNSSFLTNSTRDELTGLMNLPGLLKYGTDSIRLSLQMQNEGLVLTSDIDYLKKINSTYGHVLGDKAILAQAEILQRTFRNNDMIARIEGDEFAIVAPGVSIKDFDEIKSRYIKMSLEVQNDFHLPFTVTCSFGFAQFTKDNFDLGKLIKEAEDLRNS